VGNRTKGGHSDLTLFFGGAEFHDRWLDQRYQGHVGVCCYCDSAQKFRSQFGGEVNSGRAVGTTDDTDSCCLRCSEAEDHSACEGYEYADLSCCAQEHGLRVRDERTEVGHSAYAHEDQRREDFVFDTEADGHHDAHFVFESGVREVCHDVAECDWQKKQWFILFCDGEVQKYETYADHNDVFDGEVGKAGIGPYGNESSHKAVHVVSS